MRPLLVIVPFRLENAKSRLASILTAEERRRLALTMLGDVVEAVSIVGDVVVLSRDPLSEADISLPAKVVVCRRELDPALNQFIECWKVKKNWPADLLIAMADLPIVRVQDVEELVRTFGDVVIAPGRGGGTNLILIRDPGFRVCYYGLSYLRHLQVAQDLGMSAGVYESYRCGCDIDEPSDLVEVLLHGQGKTPELLRELGFDLNGAAENRATCRRSIR